MAGGLARLSPAFSNGPGLQKPLDPLNPVADAIDTILTPNPCVAETFPSLSLLGAEFLSIEASLFTNYSGWIPAGWRFSQPSVNMHDVSFCNITVSYTHPGHGDVVNVETWLPTDEWNGRLQAVGGGGWRAGRFILSYAGMAGAIADGYATVTTDAGLGNAVGPMPWALISPGNSNLYALQDLGSQTLNDEAIIAKHLIKSYYGREPSYSYWNGCSQGGRQGTTLAQRYPTAYDGIIAAAPAVNWAGVFISTMWPKVYMDVTGQYPQACELQELTALAVSTCDGLDGVEDGIIADTSGCKRIFDPFTYVGSRFYCPSTGRSINLTLAAAAVANAMWTGPVTAENETTYLHGLEMGTDLTKGAPTSCDENGECTGVPNSAVKLLMGYFIDKEPDLSTTKISFKGLERAFRSFKQQFDSFLASDDPDLTLFRDSGGKMITFHGLADPTIPTNISLDYYEQVLALQTHAQEFYRYFLVPGLGHCWGGRGGQPVALFDQLRSWVENGTAPESSPVTITRPDNTPERQILCPYPKKAVFRGDILQSLSGWSCV
ncbi:Carboxylic ester hydrolase [Colletotrichum higginsianum IMI 349063]|uniref:Carboxylic ester hydrolase n=1 Tax=Colletotrichum higginsianum (strain IMI 349063) TaxID=759273 RepID=A0A1B7Y4B8_COLHI|nr:Carboxylic ester hydrolase [Colletotrichum higginsianum IMI 349063]OBR06872.1 Carboxylic ester hydrolase [Colletotrichum higginsianum IMI 349063]